MIISMTLNKKEGNRAANSFTPNTSKLPADSQVDKGGFAQNGTP